MKITLIGGGNMGEAMLAAVLRKRLSTPQGIIVSDISDARRQYLAQKYGVSVTGENRTAASGADIIILAVKPQTLADAMAELKSTLKPKQLLLSIIAGAKIKTLRSGLRHRRIIRAMPNTPARIGEGITVWTATPQVMERHKKQAQSILAAMGHEIYTCDETHLDMATAVSGSGPAYFFYFVEALSAAATKLGFTPEVSQHLVLQTMSGATRLLQQSEKTPAELRRMVTSPGGTTAAAIQRLEEGKLAELVNKAVKAAYNRARELGK
ncbi:MAG: pyrroline-5-carboxylate reductase [Dehalococcoidales bacterium]|nr:pyrroline-5-carboxylate reductase [Dehalococcoidales bacterium]